MKFYLIFLFYIVFASSIFSQTQPVLKIDRHDTLELDTYFTYFIDYSKLNVQEFLEKDKKHQIRWTPVPYRGFSFGRIEDPVWMKIQITHDIQDSRYFLTSYFPLTDRVEMIVPQKNIHLISGMNEPVEKRAIKDIQFHFPLNLIKGENITLYIRADTCCSFYSTTNLYPENDLSFAIIRNNISLMVYLSFSLMIIIQSIFYFYYNRNPIYLFFIASIFFISVFHVAMFGYFYVFLIENYDINVMMLHFTAELAGYFNLLFIILLFDLDSEYPKFARYYRLSGLILFGGAVLYFTGFDHYVKYFNSITMTVVMMSYLILALSFIRIKKRRSLMFVFFWSFHILGMLFYTLSNLGIIPLYTWIVDVTLYGNALEIVGIAYLLITRGRMNVLRKIETELKTRNKEPALPSGLDINLIKEKLTHLIEDDQLHLDWDANLEMFAERLGISNNHFSVFLNTHLNTTFRDFLNLYRVKEAQKMLSEISDESIISIMHRAGFNSKSTFNRVFLETVGKTPSNFRNEALTKNTAA